MREKLNSLNPFEIKEEKPEKLDLIKEIEKKNNLELIDLKSKNTAQELKDLFPDNNIIACDFYIENAESEDDGEITGGYTYEGITNIDHHAPTERMMKKKSSTNLAIDYVKEHGPIKDSNAKVVINHSDCDSILSSLIMSGVLKPEDRFGEAAIAADHTGAENKIGDLLQAMDEKRDIEFSVRNLQKYLNNEEIEPEAKKMLEKRISERKQIIELIKDDKFIIKDRVAYIELEEIIDGGLIPSLLLDADIIILASKMPEDSKRPWLIKARIGANSPEGLALNKLNLPNFGGRWNAGATKRKGGTEHNAEEYADIVGKKLKKFKKAIK